MSKVTAVIIAKNEEKMIEEAIRSVSFCNETVVIDNNSEDKTKKVAEENGAKVYQIDSDDFSEIRNFAIQKSEGEYILYVDADERADETLQKSIEKAMENDEYAGYRIKRKNFYLGRNEWPKIEKLERFFRKKDLKGWKGKIHETAMVDGGIGDLDGFLLHFTHRDFESMLDKTIEWSTVEAYLRYNAGHPEMKWWRFPRVMISAFLNSYVSQKGFKAGTVGLLESIYQAFSIFITYAKLWELQNSAKLKKKNETN